VGLVSYHREGIIMPIRSNKLFDTIVRLTGLKREVIAKDLEEILKAIGASPETVTEDQIRKGMLQYLKKFDKDWFKDTVDKAKNLVH